MRRDALAPSTPPRAQRGFSVVIVLGVMLLLLSIAASTLAAVSAGGLGIERREDRKLELLSDSVCRSLYARLTDDEDAASLPTHENLAHLGPKLVMIIYNDMGLPLTLEVEASGSGYSLPAGVDIEVTIERSDLVREVYETAAVPAQPAVKDPLGVEIVPATERIPAQAQVNATVPVTVKVEKGGKKHIVRQTFHLTGAELNDEDEPDTMKLVTLGNWELKTHEIIRKRDS